MQLHELSEDYRFLSYYCKRCRSKEVCWSKQQNALPGTDGFNQYYYDCVGRCLTNYIWYPGLASNDLGRKYFLCRFFDLSRECLRKLRYYNLVR